jgi:two-component system, LytTR family, sensor kinase
LKKFFQHNKKTILLHSFLWIALTSACYLLNDEHAKSVGFAFLTTAFIAFPCYINEYFLIPKFLHANKKILYGILFFATISLDALATTLFVKYKFGLTSPILIVFVADLINYAILTATMRVIPLVISSIKNKRRIVELEKNTLHAEVNALKSQINPHFLLNTLNNLYGLIIQDKKEYAAQTTLQLADLMRYLLEGSKKDQVLLIDEVKFIKDYIGLEKIRIANLHEITFSLKVPDEKITIAPFLLIPIVENVFKHGLIKTCHPGYAHFVLSVQEKQLYFEAVNCLSTAVKGEISNSGIGLPNLQKRLDLLYPEKHIVQIQETELEYKITLNIDLDA